MSEASAEIKKKNDEKINLAMQQIRRTHGAWDKAKRDFEGIVAQSKNNANTSGCKFELDIGGLGEVCGKLDDQLLVIEKQFNTHNTLTDEEMIQAATIATQMTGKIQDGREKVQAIKSWLKIVPGKKKVKHIAAQ